MSIYGVKSEGRVREEGLSQSLGIQLVALYVVKSVRGGKEEAQWEYWDEEGKGKRMRMGRRRSRRTCARITYPDICAQSE